MGSSNTKEEDKMKKEEQIEGRGEVERTEIEARGRKEVKRRAETDRT